MQFTWRRVSRFGKLGPHSSCSGLHAANSERQYLRGVEEIDFIKQFLWDLCVKFRVFFIPARPLM